MIQQLDDAHSLEDFLITICRLDLHEKQCNLHMAHDPALQCQVTCPCLWSGENLPFGLMIPQIYMPRKVD